jgi:hypothetical protein
MSLFFPKKITTRGMGLEVRIAEKIAFDANPKPISVIRIWGILSSSKPMQGNLGPYTVYQGEIAALAYFKKDDDGTDFEARSTTLLVPGVVEGYLNKLFDFISEDAGKASVEFGFEITVQYNQSAEKYPNGTKFMFGVKPLIEPKGDDALALMAKRFPKPPMLIEHKGKK